MLVEDGALEKKEFEELAGGRIWLLVVGDGAAAMSKLVGVSKERGPGPG